MKLNWVSCIALLAFMIQVNLICAAALNQQEKEIKFVDVDAKPKKSAILYWMCLESCGNQFNLTNQLLQLDENKDIVEMAAYEQYGLTADGEFDFILVNGKHNTSN